MAVSRMVREDGIIGENEIDAGAVFMQQHQKQHLASDSNLNIRTAVNEIIEVLASFPGRRVAVERIVSEGQVTPPGVWYDQDGDEWVMVLKGFARLVFEKPDDEVELTENDWLLIPTHRRHRVAFTAPGTIWIAVHGDKPPTA